MHSAHSLSHAPFFMSLPSWAATALGPMDTLGLSALLTQPHRPLPRHGCAHLLLPAFPSRLGLPPQADLGTWALLILLRVVADT